MGGGENENSGFRGAEPFPFAGVAAVIEALVEGAIGAGRDGAVDEDDDAGTCWKARVTSYADILDHGPGAAGGGVAPSSDLTSCIEKGTVVRSSAIPFNEFTGWFCALSNGDDHTAFRCSGSGALEGDSLSLNAFGDFDHCEDNDDWICDGEDDPFCNGEMIS